MVSMTTQLHDAVIVAYGRSAVARAGEKGALRNTNANFKPKWRNNGGCLIDAEYVFD